MPKINRTQYILSLRKRYYDALNGKEDLIKKINDAELSEYVYNSNAIENSTLTLEDTDKILNEIELKKFVSLREIFEAKNLARVMEYIDLNIKSLDLDANLILDLHKILMKDINDQIAGRFRTKGEYVRVGTHIASSPETINIKIMGMLSFYFGDGSENIVKKISQFHLEFEHIHPFVDGNGRIGRVLNNFILKKEGFVPINIKFLDREKYYSAFKEYELRGKTNIMEDLIGLAISNSYHKRLAYLEGKKIVTLSEYAKIKKVSHSALLNKANRQTIEAFTENGVWKIGM